MRLLVCTKRDLHGARFLNRLLPALAGHHVVGVWLSDKQRPAEADVPELAELACLERSLPVDLLFPLVDALPPALADTAPAASFHGLARRHGVDLSVFDALPDAASRLAALAPDLVIVARFSHLFDAAALAVPRFGLLNLHPGHLPRYAGLHAPLRSVLEGETTLACSAHWIAPGIDDGPLLAVHPVPFDPAHGLYTQIGDLYAAALPTVQAVLADCAAGQRPPGTPQDRRLRRYRSLPDADAFRAFAARGLRLWSPDVYRAQLTAFLPPGLALPALTDLAPGPPR